MFIGIGFSFKGDSFISLITVLQFEKPVIIFDYIENIEENDEHFQLLS
jgi:hypothetical protein